MTRTAFFLAATSLFALGCPDAPFSGDGGGMGDAPSSRGDSELDFTGEVGPDGCEIVRLDSASWAPIHASWEGGADPFFHLHTNEAAYYFSVEAYTEYGDGWTGDLGTYAPLCGANGLCVYLASDAFGSYRAVAGQVDIVALSANGGSIDRPAEVHVRDLTLEHTEYGGGECLHIEEASLVAR